MRARRRIVSAVLLLPLLAACGETQPDAEQAPAVAAFSEEGAQSGQARPAQEPKARADLEQCRKQRHDGASAQERNFPCEGFLGE